MAMHDDENKRQLTSPNWGSHSNIVVDEIEPRREIDEVWDATFETLQKQLHDSGIPLRADKKLLEQLAESDEREAERLYDQGVREGMRRAFAEISNLAEPIKKQLMTPAYKMGREHGYDSGKGSGDMEKYREGYEDGKSESAREFEHKRKQLMRKGMRAGYKQGVLDTLSDIERESKS